MTDSLVFRAWATVDLQALQHNFAIARQQNPDCAIVAVIKANAYGHGMIAVASALHPVMRDGDCFGVASLEEAENLHRLIDGRPILLLEGVMDREELAIAIEAGFHLVIHSSYQLDDLQAYIDSHPGLAAESLTVWLKLETGMHRLGMDLQNFGSAWQRLRAMPAVGRCILMTHLSCADDPVSPATQRQLMQLQRFLREAGVQPGVDCQISAAASAGTLAWPQTHFQWLRPGIMLYGGSPILGEDGVERGLRPVMTLRARLIAIKDVEAGGAIGYGATYVSPASGRIGIVSMGYGDGYPRNAPNGTPVLLKSAASIVGEPRRTRLIGRVSMDMLSIDLSEIPEAAIGDEVILWGEGLPADEIARHCGTTSYELFCRITSRVHFVYR